MPMSKPVARVLLPVCLIPEHVGEVDFYIFGGSLCISEVEHR